jgi:ribulose-phosphate 3-epimerase
MMVTNPDSYIEPMSDAGADLMTVHVEASSHLHRTLQAIRGAGMKAGVAVNPATSLSTIEEIVPFLDLLLIMSVNPGFGGQAFIPQSLDKIGRAKKTLQNHQHKILLEVDGGIKIDNACAVVQAGADILVAGSAIFSSINYRETILAFHGEMGRNESVSLTGC